MVSRYSCCVPMAFVILLIAACTSLLAAPLRNHPIALSQPDGSIIRVFVSGDEHFNWIHDKDGYTIIQDPNNGFYTYAILSAGMCIPTPYIAGRSDPASMGFEKYALPPPERMPEFMAALPHGSGLSSQEIINAPKRGGIKNLVVFIRFSDESEFERQAGPYDTMFNSSSAGVNSMYNYFREVSYGQLSIDTSFYPTPSGGYIASYQDSHPRGYFQPYSATNTIGYTGGDSGSDRTTREHTLLVSAVNAIAGMVPADLPIDGDGDGKVDNICFIVKGAPTGWSSLLWPHMWSLYTQTVYLKGKQVYTYNLQLETPLETSGVGVLCHEMFHSIGAPDLYHYSNDKMQPVFKWDIMEYDLNPPQHMSAYMKYRYGAWISTIPTISANGTYTLNPLTSSTNNAYRIDSPNSSTEYFVVEFRKKDTIFEQSLPGEGMLVYRINTKVTSGNRNGPPDEVYLYRPNGTLSSDGTPASANYSADAGRTSINDNTNPSSFLSNDGPGGLKISNISAAGGTISFQLGSGGGSTCSLTKPVLISPSGNASSTPTYTWSSVSGAEQYQLWVEDSGAKPKLDQSFKASEVGCSSGAGTCSVAPATQLASGVAMFRVRAFAACNNGTYSDWSDALNFTVGGGGAVSATVLRLYPINGATAGGEATLWAQVQNTGSSALPSNAVVRFSVSGLADNWIGSTSISGLAAGGSEWYGFNWAIPSNITPGNYTYKARVFTDTTAISDWSAGQDFTIGGGITVAATITRLWPVTGAVAGGSARLCAEVMNSGGSALPTDAKISFWVGGGNLSNNLVGYAPVAGLAVNTPTSYSYNWSIPSNLMPGTYEYRARVYVGSTAISDWSSVQPFTIAGGDTGSGFNEQFDGTSAPNWSQDSGTWIVSDGKYYTNGSTLDYDSYGTSTYKADFTDLDYTALLYRTEGFFSMMSELGLVVRASGSPVAGVPTSGYFFLYFPLYPEGGGFSVWKIKDGWCYKLQGWTYSEDINPLWNKIRVIAKGSNFRYYINDKLVWQGTDSSLTAGRVGVTFYTEYGIDDDQLWVDYATLNTHVSSVHEGLTEGQRFALDLINAQPGDPKSPDGLPKRFMHDKTALLTGRR